MSASDTETKDDQDRGRIRRDGIDSFLSAELLRRESQYTKIQTVRVTAKKRAGIVFLMLILTGFLIVFSGSHLLPMLLTASNCQSSVNKTEHQTGQGSIALIDGMANEYPDSGFIDNVSSAAKTAGYRFDYYPSGNATVNFFVNLPSR